MSRRKGRTVNGWLILDKPEGPSSTQALGRIRYALGAAKAGHGGTLDPLATGVLPLAFGEATKTLPFILNADKQYRFTVRWGVATATCDREGAVVETSEMRPEASQIDAALGQFRGHVLQVPPAYSAILVDGQRAYALARAGETVDLKARAVEIMRLALVDRPDRDHAVFEVDCGKGTYVRSLARDVALALGTVGHVTQLRRTKAGPFSLDQAIIVDSLDDLGHIRRLEERLLPIMTPLDDIPALAITGEEAERVRSGQALVMDRLQISRPLPPLRDGDVVCVVTGENPVALARIDNGRLCPMRVFNLAS